MTGAQIAGSFLKKIDYDFGRMVVIHIASATHKIIQDNSFTKNAVSKGIRKKQIAERKN